MTIDLTRCRLPPFKHQIDAIQALIDNPIFANFSEMGMGKTKIVIDASQILFTQNVIDRVLVIAPAGVKSVWYDSEFGEIAKHIWKDLPFCVLEFHTKNKAWGPDNGKEPWLQFFISNYEYIRSKNRLIQLLPYCTKRTLLVLDESSAVKSHRAQQTSACLQLRKACGRVVLLNGTPVSNSPGDLYAQANIMNPAILGCKSWFHFRARYALLGGWMGKVIVGWRDLEDLQKRMAPYVIRKLKKDCLDLPPKLDSIVMSVPLSNETWRIYKDMKDEMVAFLSETSVSMASQAIVKAIRLAQITSGFLGGVETQELVDNPDLIDEIEIKKVISPVQEVGREKLDLLLSWLNDQLVADPNMKLLVWARFRPEVQRLFEELSKLSKFSLGKIWGGQKRTERDEALRLLDPRTTPKGPVVVIGTPASGAMGLNLTAAHTVVYLSNDFSLKTRLQSEDRVHRPGQLHSVSYFDIIATGPAGQKTIDHAVVKALRAKQNIADFTTSAWLDALRTE